MTFYSKLTSAADFTKKCDPSKTGFVYHGDADGISAATMLATTLGLEFNPDKAWDERKQEYKMSGRFVRTQSVVQTAQGDKNGLWTTVIVAAVFLEE